MSFERLSSPFTVARQRGILTRFPVGRWPTSLWYHDVVRPGKKDNRAWWPSHAAPPERRRDGHGISLKRLLRVAISTVAMTSAAPTACVGENLSPMMSIEQMIDSRVSTGISKAA